MNLDPIAESLAQRWGVVPTEELPGGHCSRVYADAERVLKVPYQGEEMTTGYLAMMRLSKPIGPEIYAGDEATGSMLMERAYPGTKLHEAGVSEGEQLVVWRDMVGQFRKMPSDGLMPMATYYTKYDPLVDHLIKTTNSVCALHGDLHHENILRNGDGWMCIDAKGLVGDPAVEAAAFVCNPFPDVGLRTSEQYRDRIVSVADSIDADPFRVWAWSLARMREDIEPEKPWYPALIALNGCAKNFHGERWVLPLA